AIDDASEDSLHPGAEAGIATRPATAASPSARRSVTDFVADWLEGPRWPRTAAGLVALALLVAVLAIVGGRTAMFRSGGPATSAPESAEAPALDPLADPPHRNKIRILDASSEEATPAPTPPKV